MVRISSSVPSHRRKRRILKDAKGQFGHRSRRYKQAKKSLVKGMVYSYRDRKVKKRDFRNLWIARINAACRENGLTYSRFINGLVNANIEINRKMISELAINAPEAFSKLVDVAKAAPAVKKTPVVAIKRTKPVKRIVKAVKPEKTAK